MVRVFCVGKRSSAPHSLTHVSALFYRPFPGDILEKLEVLPDSEVVAANTDDAALIESFARHYR